MQQNILKLQLRVPGPKLLVKDVKIKIKYIFILIFLSNCNLVSGTTEGVKKMSEGAATFSQGVVKAGEGIVTITQGVLPIADGIYQDSRDLARLLFAE